jgi:hypothetical protein
MVRDLVEHRPAGHELVSLLWQTVIADSARHKDAESDTCTPDL